MKKAYWIQHTHIFSADKFECSTCRKESAKPTNVCPNCGAKMMKSKYDPSWVDELEAFDALFGD
jgi:hypothetical protein